MTVIFSANGFVIESLVVPRANLANATTLNVDTDLARPARFLGGVTSLDTDTASSSQSVALLKTDGTSLAYGDAISQVRTQFRNASGGAVNIGAKVILFLGY